MVYFRILHIYAKKKEKLFLESAKNEIVFIHCINLIKSIVFQYIM